MSVILISSRIFLKVNPAQERNQSQCQLEASVSDSEVYSSHNLSATATITNTVRSTSQNSLGMRCTE